MCLLALLDFLALFVKYCFILLPVCSYTRTELLSLRTKTSLLSLFTVDRLKDLNIGYHLPRRHRWSTIGVVLRMPTLDTNVDGLIPASICFLLEQETLSALLQSTQLSNEYQVGTTL